MVTYSAVKENFEDETIGCYSSFSIAAFDDETDLDVPVKYIPDVFTDEHQAMVFVDKCNAFSLYPEHLADLIYDSI